MGRGKWDEMKVASAIGRCLLGGGLGFVLWAFLFLRWCDPEWGFSLWVVAGFIVGGALAGLLVGDRFVR